MQYVCIYHCYYYFLGELELMSASSVYALTVLTQMRSGAPTHKLATCIVDGTLLRPTLF
jgi:hypothetical protein